MLEKPDIKDEIIITCLEREYGLRVEKITFLPLGQDLSTAVYRVVASDQTPYFCKLKRGVFDEATIKLPNFLSKQGIAQIIAPLMTGAGELCAELGEFKLILYPFVEGKNGYDVELSESQWRDFGAAFKQIHTTRVPPSLFSNIRKENYSAEWRERCRSILKRMDDATFDDAITSDLITFLRSQRELILGAIERAEQLAQAMLARSIEFVLCHSDIHPGNLLIDTRGTLFVVDWDYPMLAPKERDLMFIGGGQGFMPHSAEHEELLFYRGYDQAQRDPIALAYYRYERCITDISVECERIFSSTLGDPDRTQSLQILKWYFLPNGTMERAYSSDRTQSDG
jgi:spectinomycin phosphotransferase